MSSKSLADPGRRAFLATVAAIAAATGCAPRHPATRAPAPRNKALVKREDLPPIPPASEITRTTIAEASKLFGVEPSEAEREQILEGLEAQIVRAVKRREHELPNALAPASVFDPRLPGMRFGHEKSRLRRAAHRPGPLPTSNEDIAFAPLRSLAHWIERRQLSSERLTRIYLERLDRIGPELECVATLMREQALEQARAADEEIARGRYRGPLHGIPWGAKDLFDTKGIETAWGAAPFRGRVPDGDAVVVKRLADAGAVLVAKLTLGALAYGDIWYGGRTNNPWNTKEGSSGSSAGPAAATAAGLVGFSLGTETLGSIVSPCMRCGTTGLRPTFGRVPRTGAMALCWSLDKIGPICRTVEDCILVLAAIHGEDPGDAASISLPLVYDGRGPLRDLKVGYRPQWLEGDEVNLLDRAALAALRRTGVRLVEIDLPELPYDALVTELLAEAAAAFEPLTLSNRDDELSWQDADAWPNTFRQARFISAIDLVQASRLRREVMQVMARVFDRVDAIIGPSYADPMLLVTNCTGHPCITLRAGFERKSTRRRFSAQDQAGAAEAGEKREVPYGVTLWGRLFDEGTLCRIASALEADLAVWDRRPPVG